MLYTLLVAYHHEEQQEEQQTYIKQISIFNFVYMLVVGLPKHWR